MNPGNGLRWCGIDRIIVRIKDVAGKGELVLAGKVLNLKQDGLVADFKTLHLDGPAFQFEGGSVAGGKGFVVDDGEPVAGGG